MSELDIISLIFAICSFIEAYRLKTKYIETVAVCLGYLSGGFVTYPLYQYEMEIQGKVVVLESRGTAIFGPKRGRKYQVLVKKNNYTEVKAYNIYVSALVLGSFFVLCFAVSMGAELL